MMIKNGPGAVIFLWVLLLSASPMYGQSNGASAGDALRCAIPAGVFLWTCGMNDDAGKIQFLKSLLSASTVTYGLKKSVEKNRPNGKSHAFPSGHATVVFSSAGFMHRRYGFKKALPVYAMAMAVGWSRIQSDNHDFYDVGAGAAIGMAGAFYFSTAFSREVSVQPVVAEGRAGLVISTAW